MLIVDKRCSDVCCDEFPVPQIDHKSKKSKRTVTWYILFAMSMGKTRIVKSDNLQHNLLYTKTGKELQGIQ